MCFSDLFTSICLSKTIALFPAEMNRFPVKSSSRRYLFYQTNHLCFSNLPQHTCMIPSLFHYLLLQIPFVQFCPDHILVLGTFYLSHEVTSSYAVSPPLLFDFSFLLGRLCLLTLLFQNQDSG